MPMPKSFDERVVNLLRELAAECERAGVREHTVMLPVDGAQATFHIAPDPKYKRTA